MSELEDIVIRFVPSTSVMSEKQKTAREEAKQAIEAYISKHYIKRADVLEAIDEGTSRLGGRNGYEEAMYNKLVEKLNLGDK